ncbi:MAG: DUF4250 domain-containing protein [Paludibacteraceae bacterium]|nr:DUF4250 domain-containing protein [Paludibacteraceae bacterium]
MDTLPTQPAILVSTINMLLRDGEFSSLEDLAAYYDREPEDIKQQLLAAGYCYNEELQQFRAS